MKFFSILNKPAAKADNKQAGLVFLEYVIMAFIVTVAVICALWWFYWHLQQMTWEVKQKLDTLKTLSCELGKPGGPESVQPTPVQRGVGRFQSISSQTYYMEAPYSYQTITIQNHGSQPLTLDVNIGGIVGQITLAPAGDTLGNDISSSSGAVPGPPYSSSYHVVNYTGPLTDEFTVTITPGP